jgi:hypothetical protein
MNSGPYHKATRAAAEVFFVFLRVGKDSWCFLVSLSLRGICYVQIGLNTEAGWYIVGAR